MVGLLLFTAGILVLVGTVAVARQTKQRDNDEAPTGHDAEVFTPRSVASVEAERTRLWPVAAALVGLTLVAAGLGWVQRPPVEEAPPAAEPSHTPFALLVRVAGGGAVVTTPSPTPSETPSASPAAAGQTSGAESSSGPAAAGADVGPPPATSRPTPTPTPKPGPAIGANASCFQGTLEVGYTATARSGTTLSSVTLLLDGRVVENPSVAGRSRYSGNYQAQGGGGSHTFTVAAQGSDGGVSSRSFPTNC
jgi:hypothetical protein